MDARMIFSEKNLVWKNGFTDMCESVSEKFRQRICETYLI